MNMQGSVPQSRPIVFEIIRGDHAEIRELLAEATRTTGADERKIVREALCSKIEAHLKTEERVLFPPLRKFDALDSFMDQMAMHHRLIRDAMAASVDAHLRDEAFAQALEHLRIQFSQHFDEEERRLFGYMTQHLRGELDSLAIEMEHARNRERGAFGVG
jgi:hemerythrin